MWKRTSRHAMKSIRRVVTVGFVVAGAVLASPAGSAHAAIAIRLGDVYCHATAAGAAEPRYFYSGVTEVTVTLLRWSTADWWKDWTSLDAITRSDLERRTLDDLVAEFASGVAELHEVDFLLSARCDLMQEYGEATAAIDAAAYFRDGARVPYPPGGKIVIDWVPDFVAVAKRHVAAQVRSGRVGALTAYAVQPGDLASDGLGAGAENSPYTQALLARLGEPGVEVEVLFRRVAADVIASTDGAQHPEVRTTLAELGSVQLAGATELVSSPGQTKPRVALVIGNGAYEHVGELANPVNDARAVAAALERLGFEVTVVTEATREDLDAALEAFSRKSAYVDIALAFYSGQGFRRDGVDYLVPIGADMQTAHAATVQSVPVGRMIEAARGARVPIVVLDTSRYELYDDHR